VVAGVHNPWVTTDTSFKEFEQMRVEMEPLMYQFGVDIMFNGARAAFSDAVCASCHDRAGWVSLPPVRPPQVYPVMQVVCPMVSTAAYLRFLHVL